MTYITIFRLVGSQIGKPFGVEFFGIVIQTGCADKYLRIPGPSQTLVSLGTICWYIYKISFLSPDDIRKKLIQFWVGTAQITGTFHV